MPTGRSEIAVKCDHGLNGQGEQFIQRYRWSASKALWVGTMATTGPRLLMPGGRSELKCPICHETVPARNEKLIEVLNRGAGVGASQFPLSALSRALSMVG